MIVYPPAKINLGLSVTTQRPDGFHNLVTGFYPIGLCDILEFLPDEHAQLTADRLELSGLPVPGLIEDNLILKACRMFRARHSIPFLYLHLHKRIPMGAGLGGGSSDAAQLLLGLNKLAGSALDQTELAAMALQLGSDCPFFLNPRPAIGRGRGELLKPAEISLAGHYLYVFNQGIHVSTRGAYAAVSLSEGEPVWLKQLQFPVDSWQGVVNNSFEGPVFSQHPEIADLKNRILELGALFASMSGSGSSVFGIFREAVKVPGDIEQQLVYFEQLS